MEQYLCTRRCRIGVTGHQLNISKAGYGSGALKPGFSSRSEMRAHSIGNEMPSSETQSMEPPTPGAPWNESVPSVLTSIL